MNLYKEDLLILGESCHSEKGKLCIGIDIQNSGTTIILLREVLKLHGYEITGQELVEHFVEDDENPTLATWEIYTNMPMKKYEEISSKS